MTYCPPHLKKDYIRKTVIARYGRTCVYCGKKGLYRRSLCLDHVVPVSKGGKTEVGNLVVCCSGCNMKKGNADLADYVRRRLTELDRERDLLERLLSRPPV